MGTFHDGKGDLHGITVAVDTHGPTVYVGRCHEVTEAGVILLDADEHTEGREGPSKREYLERAAQVGVWKKHDRLVVPREQVASIRRLGDIAAELP